MPKQIPNLKEMLLEKGREVLEEKGYAGFTMRSVSDACGIGLGTAYNYYENKDALLSLIMLEDWKTDVSKLQENLLGAKKDLDRAECLYDCIALFSGKYLSVWSQYAGSSHAADTAPERHQMLIERLSAISGLRPFLVEVLVHFATVHGGDFASVKTEIEKMI